MSGPHGDDGSREQHLHDLAAAHMEHEAPEFATANGDYTLDIPPIVGTVPAHPASCECSPCADRADWKRKENAGPVRDYGSVADWQRETARDDIANGFG